MRVVIDGLPIHGDSLSIVSEHLLQGWESLGGDELHLVVGPDPQIEIPESVTVHTMRFGRMPFVGRIYAQSVRLPRLCRKLGADVLLGVLPTTSAAPLPCPRAIIAYDLRYRLRPEQFSRKALLLRRASYGIGFRQADAIACISARTKGDLLHFHPRLARREVQVAHLGADHVDSWPDRPDASDAPDGTDAPSEPFALAFGHYSNKNVDLVLEAWAVLHARGGASTIPLNLVGVSKADQPVVAARLDELGLTGVVTIAPWLPVASFRRLFASCSVVVFPSDFEGFGLPAVEAMRLGIPVVISADPALLEVTGGHATVVDGPDFDALATAVETAQHTSPEALAAARRHAEPFTWANFAMGVRRTLRAVAAPEPVPVPVPAPLPRTRTRTRTRPAWAGTRLRVAGTFLAGALALGGVSAVAYAVTAPSASKPAAHPGGPTTSTISGGPAAHAGRSVSGGGGSSRTSAHVPASVTAPGTSLPGTSGSGQSGTSGSNGASGGNSPPGAVVPPVTAPTVTPPSVTVPTAPSTTAPSTTVPSTTVPGSVCTTTTVVGTTVVSTPCNVPAP